MLSWLGCAAVLLVGCFHPSYPDVRCGTDNACPSGMACNPTSGTCEGPGGGSIADAATSGGPAGSDGHPGDAQPGCFGVGLLGNLCLSSAPTIDVMLSSAINTDTAGTCTQVFPQTGSPTAAPELCAIVRGLHNRRG